MRKIKLNITRGGLVAALLLTLLISLPGAALADSFDGTLNVLGYHEGYYVNYKLDGDYSGAKTVEYNLSIEYDLFMEEMKEVGYCADLLQTIGVGSFDVDIVTPLDTMARIQAAWLMQTYAPGLSGDYVNYGYRSTKKTITALQLAIWEVLYDYSSPSGMDLSEGRFEVTSVSNYYWDVMNLANSFLSSIPSDLSASSFPGFGVAESNFKQDLIFGGGGPGPNPGAEVPEPTSMLLFASALGAGGWFRRRSLKKKEAKQD